MRMNLREHNDVTNSKAVLRLKYVFSLGVKMKIQDREKKIEVGLDKKRQ